MNNNGLLIVISLASLGLGVYSFMQVRKLGKVAESMKWLTTVPTGNTGLPKSGGMGGGAGSDLVDTYKEMFGLD